MAPDAPVPRVVHHARSPLGDVFVVDEGDERSLRYDQVDAPRQSLLLKSAPEAVPLPYVRLAVTGLALTAGRTRALVVGLGGGTFPRLLLRAAPRMAVDVVEVNPVVVDVARRFFGVREDRRLRIHLEDGARFLSRDGPRYDLALLDAFSGAGTPEHLKTPPFFADVRRRLRPGGVALVNLALSEPEEKARVLATLVRTFPHCARLHGPPGSGNVLAVGATAPLPPEPQLLAALGGLEQQLSLPGLAETLCAYRDVSADLAPGEHLEEQLLEALHRELLHLDGLDPGEG